MLLFLMLRLWLILQIAASRGMVFEKYTTWNFSCDKKKKIKIKSKIKMKTKMLTHNAVVSDGLSPKRI